MERRPRSETRPRARRGRPTNRPAVQKGRPEHPRESNTQMNPNAAIDAYFDGSRWIAWTVGYPDLWRDFYPLDMTRAQVLRAARADYIAECC